MSTATATRKRITRHLSENVQAISSGSRVDREKCIIHGVKLAGLHSPNRHGLNVEGTDYTPQAFEQARTLYEGAKCKANHPPRTDPNRERDIDDTLGKFRNVSIREGEPYGDLHLLPSHPLTSRILDAAETMPDLFCLSHNADGVGHVDKGRYVITEIVRVNSVDLVDKGATTRSLFESAEDGDMRKSVASLTEKVDRLTKLMEAGYSGPGLHHATAKRIVGAAKKAGINPHMAHRHFGKLLGDDHTAKSIGSHIKGMVKNSVKESAMPTIQDRLSKIGIDAGRINRLMEMDLATLTGMASPESEEGDKGDWKSALGNAILGILADPNLAPNDMRDKIIKTVDVLSEPEVQQPAAPAAMGDAMGGDDGTGDLTEDGGADDDFSAFGDDDDASDEGADDTEDDDTYSDEDSDSEASDDMEDDDEKKKGLTMKESQELKAFRRQDKARQLCESQGWSNPTNVQVKAVAALESEKDQKELIAQFKGTKPAVGPKSSGFRNVQESQNGTPADKNRLVSMFEK